ncbi:MAG: hypothetical protein LAN71_13460 [Acidobacteriia bacterium]|nr:hypothetical protein [Terriglobia bacterium]
MWNWLKAQKRQCGAAQSRTQDLMNGWAGTDAAECLAAADGELRQHLETCADCLDGMEQSLAARRMLRQNAAAAADPGAAFTRRIMLAVNAAAEQSAAVANPWMALPAVASRMAWVCAVALLLAAVWLHETRAYVPPARSTVSGEISLVSDSAAENEEVLVSVARSEP